MEPKIIIIKERDKIISINTNITNEFEAIVIDLVHTSMMEKIDNQCEIDEKYYINVDFKQKGHITED